MTPTLTSILDGIKKKEGGFVDHPDDKGGPTHWGITQATLGSWRKRPVTRADIQALEWEEAAAIYTARYIAPYLPLPDCLLRTQLIDFGVHSGQAQAVRSLQKVLGVKADGQFGPITAAHLAAHPDWRSLNNLYAGERVRFLARLVEKKPSQVAFLEGWMNRATSFLI